MEKCIYYGTSRDFWWHSRFEEFMDNLDSVKRISDKSFLSIYSPVVWFSNEYNAAIQYILENTICPQVIDGEEPFVQRAKVTLFGKFGDIQDLEILIRSEAGRFHGRDSLD